MDPSIKINEQRESSHLIVSPSELIESQSQSALLNLPLEIIERVFQGLGFDYSAIAASSRVCKSWRDSSELKQHTQRAKVYFFTRILDLRQRNQSGKIFLVDGALLINELSVNHLIHEPVRLIFPKINVDVFNHLMEADQSWGSYIKMIVTSAVKSIFGIKEPPLLFLKEDLLPPKPIERKVVELFSIDLLSENITYNEDAKKSGDLLLWQAKIISFIFSIKQTALERLTPERVLSFIHNLK